MSGKEASAMGTAFYDTRLSESGGVMLVKEKEADYEVGKMDSPEKIVQIMTNLLHLDQMAEEYCYMAALNSACRILGVFLLSKGTVNASLVSPRELYIRALLSGAVHVILCHNHPSGDPKPSSIDIRLTEKVKQAGVLLDVGLTDHVIIGGGNGNYFSFKEAGML